MLGLLIWIAAPSRWQRRRYVAIPVKTKPALIEV
jgi:hypothetical protein